MTITIIAPIYGVERYIEQFAESVLSQSYPYIEYIFVNDGTKDNSIVLLEKLISKKYEYRRAQIKIIHKQNEGLPAARATGIEHATGDYVYHVDSDDWLSKDAIQKIVSCIQQTNADVVFFNYVKEYPSRSKLKRERSYTNEQRKLYIQNMYTHRSYGSLCNKCIRRSLYTENHILIPIYGYAEDCCVTTQLVGYARSIAYLNEYIYHYRKGNPNAMTSQRVKQRKQEYIKNVLALYEGYSHLPMQSNPISPIMDCIVMQAGWYSLLYGFNLFEDHAYLAEAIRRSKLQSNSNVCVFAQCITKLYVLFFK